MLDLIELDNIDIRPEISFFRQEALECPVCGKSVSQEDMRTGSGRLDAGPLSNDLHREYLATDDFGRVIPIMYNIYTCNNCYYSLLKQDFARKMDKETIANLKNPDAKKQRLELLHDLFKKTPDFSKQKTVQTAIAAYLLAIKTYDQFSSKDSGTIRMAICSLRTAWLFHHMEEFSADENLEYFKKIFYRKAYFLYSQAIDLHNARKEDLTDIGSLGPDFDKDYGFDGVIYLHAWLFINYGYVGSPLERENKLNVLRTDLSRVFGFGKSSKEKPSALLNIARDIYEIIEKEIKAML